MNYFDFVHQFPDFHLEDKAIPNGDSIVVDQIINPSAKAILLRVYYKKRVRNNKKSIILLLGISDAQDGRTAGIWCG